LATVRRRLLLVLVALAVATPAEAAVDPPSSGARAVLVATGAGEVLYERSPERELPMASITKLMTAIVVLERKRPGDLMTVRETAAGVGESSVHLLVGEKLSVRDLLAAALIQSANDAAFALAAGTAGSVSEFVGLMNAKARQLGLAHTHFVRPDGLDVPGHYSSARDVLKLARVAMKKPLVRRLVAMQSATIAGGRSLFSWNDLLGRYPGLIGVKTGHTNAAGWCEVAAARRDGVTIYTVVLGSPSRAQRNADLTRLLAWGQDFFGPLQVISTGHTYATSAIRLGEDRLPLVAARPVSAVVRLDQPLVETVVAPGLVSGPVEGGASLGEVRVLQRGRVVATVPLVAARAVEEPGFGHKLSWYSGRTLDEASDLLEGVFGSVL
jgi:serine-type D-Ala-D-Ala carboxypeptidase (penicillin-binding protein 5/6)